MKIVSLIVICIFSLTLHAEDNNKIRNDGSKLADCKGVTNKCLKAGFLPGFHKKGEKGLWVDCVAKLANGESVDGVDGVSQKDANQCRAAHLGRNTGTQYPACVGVVGKCMKADVKADHEGQTYTGYFPGNHAKTGKGLWVDCVGKLAKGEAVEGVSDVSQEDAKKCHEARIADRDPDLKGDKKDKTGDKKKKDGAGGNVK